MFAINPTRTIQLKSTPHMKSSCCLASVSDTVPIHTRDWKSIQRDHNCKFHGFLKHRFSIETSVDPVVLHRMPTLISYTEANITTAPEPISINNTN